MITSGIKKSKEFSSVYKSGKSVADKYFVLYYRRNKLDYSRIGYSVSKKVGNAVVRNRIKRLLKETYRLNFDDFKIGYDFVFIARVRAKDIEYIEVEKSMKKLFGRIK